MTQQPELDFSGRYPRTPGYKRPGTSSDAAAAMGSRAVTLRARVLQVLVTGPATADEVAGVLGESVLAVRPRFSELRKLGRIVETDERHENKSGKSAVVWRLAEGGSN